MMGIQSSTCAYIIDLIIIPVFKRKKREQRGLRIWFVQSHNYDSNWQSSFSKPYLIRASHLLSHHPWKQECLRSYDHMYKNCSSCWEARTGSFQNKPSDGRVDSRLQRVHDSRPGVHTDEDTARGTYVGK